MTDDPTRQLVDGLWSTTTFEDGAAILARALLGVVQRGVEASRLAGQARVLRAMVHLRPGGHYQDLVIARPVGAGGDDVPMRPSATVWKHVSERGVAAAVNVPMGGIEFAGAWGDLVPWGDAQGGGSWEGGATIQRLLDRDVTHVCALPLRAPGGGIQGMASIEVNCAAAIQAPFVWAEFAEELQLLTDIGTPALLALPRKPTATERDDPLLPVAGEAMASVAQLLGVFSRMDETVLLSGPTGAGKSRLARWCHAHSQREEGPFETVDLLGIPDNMQMAELFGWKRGAFTGAVSDHDGFVTRASGGTVFIDEIDKLSLQAQAGLLQLLESRRYRPLGDNAAERTADVRFVVGTNADLQAAITEGRFREDLYFRINVLPIRLPPLDERRDEIGAWARFMIQRRHEESGMPGDAAMAADAVAELIHREWPGNLRQLDNVVRRAYAVGLADTGVGADRVVITARHVQGALGLESTGPGKRDKAGGLLGALNQAARAFVDEAIHHQAHGSSMDLDLADAFRGAVLSAGHVRLKDLREVYLLFGRDKVVRSRNHQRDFRREMDRLDALAALIKDRPGGAKPRGPFRR